VKRFSILVAVAGALVLSMLVHTKAQNRVTSIASGGTPIVPDSEVNGPVPRLPDGHPDLSGPWLGGGSNADIERDGGLKPGELPLLPWAKQVRDNRKEQDEPYVACTPMSVPRINPFPWKMVYSLTPKGITEIYILHELGDAGAHRVVYMDDRKHPDAKRLYPTWYGHSIGRWDGDTLVIDTVGYNDKFWFDSRGTPHTEQLHTIERFSRPNYGTLINDFTLDDPGAYARPVQLRFTARRVRQDVELMEDICTEDNQAGIAGGYTLNPNNEKDEPSSVK
jgi:hypothetical protein